MNSIITSLKNGYKPYRQILTFSDKPGIYAIFFTGDEFPLQGFKPQKDDIVYIGKTERSQAVRDEKTHFASGKTGSSTIRRSLGALLKEELSLIPVPRSDNDFDAGRKSFFKFDEPSEERLTNWMKENLGLAFYESDQTPSIIDELETSLISELKPVLNIDIKNPGNPYAPMIKKARKECADEANQGTDRKKPEEEPVKTKVVPFRQYALKPAINEHKYEEIFKAVLPLIEKAIVELSSRKISIPLSQAAFKKVSTRQTFAFNLEFNNGVISNNTGGSSVARDLGRVLEQNAGIISKLQGRHLKFNMDKGFVLWISRK